LLRTASVGTVQNDPGIWSCIGCIQYEGLLPKRGRYSAIARIVRIAIELPQSVVGIWLEWPKDNLCTRSGIGRLDIRNTGPADAVGEIALDIEPPLGKLLFAMIVSFSIALAGRRWERCQERRNSHLKCCDCYASLWLEKRGFS